ncbi:MAG: hypothetical protein GY696_21550 [Gammaproteobacteria bacterium]|nr:hypothetical protein [Gammaproteobacteria bacterium]
MDARGGGEEAQEDLKSTQAKIRKGGGMCMEEGGPPVQADPKLQFNDNQQKRSSSEKINTQGRSTVKKMVFNLLMACGAMLGVMPGPASGYSLEYFDCRSLTKIDLPDQQPVTLSQRMKKLQQGPPLKY